MEKSLQQTNVPYEIKFKNFIKLCEDLEKDKGKPIVISHPEVLGDTYEEIIQSLHYVAKSGAGLFIAS